MRSRNKQRPGVRALLKMATLLKNNPDMGNAHISIYSDRHIVLKWHARTQRAALDVFDATGVVFVDQPKHVMGETSVVNIKVFGFSGEIFYPAPSDSPDPILERFLKSSTTKEKVGK